MFLIAGMKQSSFMQLPLGFKGSESFSNRIADAFSTIEA
jgi:hypothetical protein